MSWDVGVALFCDLQSFVAHSNHYSCSCRKSTHSLIDLVKIESGLNKELTVCVRPVVESLLFMLAHTSVGALMNGMSGRSWDIDWVVCC